MIINMQVVKRSGIIEKISFDKITQRIEKLCSEEDLKFIDPIRIAQVTIKSIHNGIKTEEIDIISSNVAQNLSLEHYKYGLLGAKIRVSNLHKNSEHDYLNYLKNYMN